MAAHFPWSAPRTGSCLSRSVEYRAKCLAVSSAVDRRTMARGTYTRQQVVCNATWESDKYGELVIHLTQVIAGSESAVGQASQMLRFRRLRPLRRFPAPHRTHKSMVYPAVPSGCNLSQMDNHLRRFWLRQNDEQKQKVT
jgi:hypothetical protein